MSNLIWALRNFAAIQVKLGANSTVHNNYVMYIQSFKTTNLNQMTNTVTFESQTPFKCIKSLNVPHASQKICANKKKRRKMNNPSLGWPKVIRNSRSLSLNRRSVVVFCFHSSFESQGDCGICDDGIRLRFDPISGGTIKGDPQVFY